MVELDKFKYSFFLRDIDVDFSKGRRSNLRWALSTTSRYTTKVNPKGFEPIDYIEFAKTDLQEGTAKSSINALSNAKRGVHLMVDSILNLWNLQFAFGRSNFPDKMDLFQKLDIFPIRLVNNLNRKRNLIEHEYEVIDYEEALDFVEIAEMFLLLSYPFLKKAVIGTLVGPENENKCIQWLLNPIAPTINICEIDNPHFVETKIGCIYSTYSDNFKSTPIGSIQISSNNIEEWLPYLDLFVYCTKKSIVSLPKSDSRGDGEYFVNTSISIDLSDDK
jgi:hypothetical protein